LLAGYQPAGLMPGGGVAGPLRPPGVPGAGRDQAEMVMLPRSVAWSLALSVTLMVTVNGPAMVGVPPRWPPVRTKPGGSWPAATVQVNGPVPPEVKKFWK